jgi:hypothetical protein
MNSTTMWDNNLAFPQAYKTQCFCRYCGAKCITTHIPDGFLTTTGNPMFWIRHVCPNEHIFQSHTDFIVSYNGIPIDFIKDAHGDVLTVGLSK